MPVRRIISHILVVLGFFPAALSAQPGTLPPPLTLDSIDIFSAFRLPPFKDTADGPLNSAISNVKAVVRGRTLKLDGGSSTDAWNVAQAAIPRLQQLDLPISGTFVKFYGLKASDLNRFLEGAVPVSIRIVSPVFEADQPILIRRDGITLDFGSAVITNLSSDAYALRIENCSNVIVQGGEFTGAGSAVLVNNASKVVVRNTYIHDLSVDGIVVTNSSQIVLVRNRLNRVTGAGVVLHATTTSSLIQDNQVSNGKGASNMAAGIVITAREVSLASNPLALLNPDGYWAISQPMSIRIHPPHDNIILHNSIVSNLSSGIYIDGAVRNILASNTVERNSKEGICLDYGAAANIITGNSIVRNGQRWGESDAVLALDYILGAGRLDDGTPAAKVPGVSIDNALYNVVFSNNIAHNYGGGVKFVRTGFFNAVGMNTLLSNNEGANSIYHFSGVDLGAAPGDSSDDDIDYTPSQGNIIFSNPIRGSHYSGVSLGDGSDYNDLFDNVILDAQTWAIESAAPMSNSSLNNLTNLPSRNISSGLDPALAALPTAK